MGTDCKLFSNDNDCLQLDRWYLFSKYFENGIYYSKENILHGINLIFSNIFDDHVNDWEPHRRKAMYDHYVYWLREVIKYVKKHKATIFVFYADFDNKYFINSMEEKCE